MRINKTFAGAAIATVAILMASAASAAVTINSFAQGWVNDDGQANGGSDGNNTFTGNTNGDRYNSWAAFFIPTGVVFTSADLKVLADDYNNNSADQIKMYSVTTSYNTLDHSWGGVAAYNDLGAGSLYGVANMLNGLTTTSLGGTALADIQGAAGSIFIVGFTNATTNAMNTYNSNTGVYTNGGQDHHPTLTLGTAGAVPEPATWAMMITGFGMAGVSLRRRRSALVAA
jgi:hypothetical protein